MMLLLTVAQLEGALVLEFYL